MAMKCCPTLSAPTFSATLAPNRCLKSFDSNVLPDLLDTMQIVLVRATADRVTHHSIAEHIWTQLEVPFTGWRA